MKELAQRGEPVRGLAQTTSLNGRRTVANCSMNRIAHTVSHLGLARASVSHDVCDQHDWTRFGTNVFLGRQRPPGRTQQHRDPLDPDGWLARFASQPEE
jgi:hypothetical protein